MTAGEKASWTDGARAQVGRRSRRRRPTSAERFELTSEQLCASTMQSNCSLFVCSLRCGGGVARAGLDFSPEGLCTSCARPRLPRHHLMVTTLPHDTGQVLIPAWGCVAAGGASPCKLDSGARMLDQGY